MGRGPYAGLLNDRVLEWKQTLNGWVLFLAVCCHLTKQAACLNFHLIASCKDLRILMFLTNLLLSSSSVIFALVYLLLSSSLAAANNLAPNELIRLPKVVGPESLAFDCNGDGPYVGVSDGRILKWSQTLKQWLEFALTSPHRDRKFCDGTLDSKKEPTCGRPLGLKFHKKTCNLYIADAYFGLLMVGPSGGVAQQLATSANDGSPFQFLNALDIDEKSGVVYFSDSSTVFQRRCFQLVVLTGDRTGRLLKYDPSSKKAQVLVQGFAFPNGVALSKDGSFLLLAESTFNIIHKVWLKGSKAYTSELFATLKRSPDNIKTNNNGDFWVALNSYRAVLGNADHNAIMQKETLMPWWKKEDPVAVRLDENGEALEVLDGGGGQELNSVSEVEEHDGKLWIGSSVKDYVAIVNNA
ncbi:protein STRICTOSIDINE SYNTHASE-LIKE 10-like [Neltuma alba]|uniref:protein STRICTOSIDINE SYNTHASE-LIKE 10-like n=1 Tax=Neltuma alba TaxID=207710 RepID=UPI0010A490BD|nr:protein STRICTOSIDINE SYNTHASE-LIKE 10-like [Prosopis alba]